MAAAIATIESATTVVLLFRKPRIAFYHFYAILPVKTDGKEQKVKMILGRINNLKGALGETGRELECNMAHRAKIHDTHTEFSIFLHPLPWLESNFADDPISVGPINSDLDIIKLFESAMLKRDKKDIPQGHNKSVTIALLFESGKKMYWATNPPELIEPSPTGASGYMTQFALELSGDNLPSIYSPTSFLMVFGNQWTTHAQSEVERTPNIILNLLLKLGIWRDQKDFSSCPPPGVNSDLPIKHCICPQP